MRWSLRAAGLHSKVYRQDWADKGHDPKDHYYLITRIAMVRPTTCSLPASPWPTRADRACTFAAEAGGMGHSLLEGPGEPRGQTDPHVDQARVARPGAHRRGRGQRTPLGIRIEGIIRVLCAAEGPRPVEVKVSRVCRKRSTR